MKRIKDKNNIIKKINCDNEKLDIKRILYYLIEEYKIRVPIIKNHIRDFDTFKIILTDGDDRTFFFEFDTDMTYIEVLVLGKEYIDYYDIDNKYIYLSKRIYENKNTKTKIEKIQNDDKEYDMNIINGIKYYYEKEINSNKQKINGSLYNIYEFKFTNQIFKATINLKIPENFPFVEGLVIKKLLKIEVIDSLEELFGIFYKLVACPNAIIRINKKKEYIKKDNPNQIDFGVVRKKNNRIEEEVMEYVPKILLKSVENNKTKKKGGKK